MAINLKLPQLPKIKKGKAPTKTYINVMIKKKQVISLQKRIPVIIAIVIIAAVVCKFAVVDRVAVLMTESAHIASMQAELAEANGKIQSMKDVDDVYAHYTVSGMTEEELGRVDRVQAMKLIDRDFMRDNVSKSWNLTGNTMTLEVSGPSLRELNQVAEALEEKPIVERCVISSANKRAEESNDVKVTFVIYLKQPDEEEE